jgi:signal transduction histidine kinase
MTDAAAKLPTYPPSPPIDDDDPAVLREENRALEDALSVSRKRLGALREVARALAGALELDKLLAVVVEQTTLLVDCDRATVFVVDADRGELWSRVAQGAAATIRLPLGQGIAGFVAKSGVPLNIADAYKDPRFHPGIDKVSGYTTKSILAAPIKDARGAPTGVVQALNKRGGRPFTVEDERLLEAVSDQVSVALQNALLFEETREKARSLEIARTALARRVSELDLLVGVEQAVALTRGADDVLDVVVARATEVVKADAASIALFDSTTAGLRFRAASGAAKDRILDRHVRPDLGIVGAAVETQRPVRVDDAASDGRHAEEFADDLGFTPGPLLAVPILAEDRSLGAIEVMRGKGGGPFTDDDERILGLLASRVANALSVAARRDKDKRAEQLQTMGTMLAGIVHDLKTPMTVISGYVQLMAVEDDPAERQKCADIVLKQTGMMTSMTKELLQFARGETEILLRKVPLPGFLHDVEDMAKRIVAGTAIRAQTHLGYRGAVRMDEVKMKRALANLAKNAKEAMGAAGTITISVEAAGDQVEFVVKDDGPGIPAEIQGRLFESFATHGKKDGTGLGLALVKKIVEDHQGEVRVESMPGQGVTFRLRLPL